MINEQGKLVITWCVDDVLIQAFSNRNLITQAEAVEILAQADRCHDACYGICWDTFDVYIEALVDAREPLDYTAMSFELGALNKEQLRDYGRWIDAEFDTRDSAADLRTTILNDLFKEY